MGSRVLPFGFIGQKGKYLVCIIRNVGREIQGALVLKSVFHNGEGTVAEDTAMMIFGLGPWIGKENCDIEEGVLKDVIIEYEKSIRTNQTDVVDLRFLYLFKGIGNAWSVYFYTQKVEERILKRSLDQTFPHTESNFQTRWMIIEKDTGHTESFLECKVDSKARPKSSNGSPLGLAKMPPIAEVRGTPSKKTVLFEL